MDDISVVEKVMKYDELLQEIFKYLDNYEINRLSIVCQKWYNACRTIDAKRRIISHFTYCFTLPRFDMLCKSKELELESTLVNFKSSLSEGTEGFEKYFDYQLKNCYASPVLMILLEGNNTKVDTKNRKWKRTKIINGIRSKLPPKCSIIGIDAHYGIIGGSGALKSNPSVINHSVCGAFGVSCCLIPCYKGVFIQIFDRMNEQGTISKDIKAMILFSSGVSHKGEYLTHPSVESTFELMKGNLALGGAQVNDKLTTQLHKILYFGDDTANYYFINGPPPYNRMYNPQKMSLISLVFGGPNCEASSIVVESLSQDNTIDPESDIVHIRITLEMFRNNLEFNPDYSSKSETLAFLFFNHIRYQRYVSYFQSADSVINIFYSIFPSTKIIGMLTHAQYEFNHWPGINPKMRKVPMPNILPSTKSIASFVIIYINKE